MLFLHNDPRQTMHKMTLMMHNVPVPSLQVVSAGWAEFAPGQEVRPHQHPTWELVYFLRGEICCPIGRDVFHVAAGDMLLTPPRTVHYETAEVPWSCFFIAIDAPAEHPWPRIYHDDARGMLAGLCSILVREWNGLEPERYDMLMLLVRQLDILLRRSFVQEHLSPAERLVRDVERRIEQGFSKPVTIKDLAYDVGVSHSYLRARFLSLRGRSPMAYLQTLRVQHAIALIANSDLSLEVIAQHCGYHSASHLSRSIKQVTGKRPGAFRYGSALPESSLFGQSMTS